MSDQTIQQMQFHYLANPQFLRQRKKLKLYLFHLFQKEKISVNHINYIFCSDRYLHSLNQEFLSHDTFTDILTFFFHQPGEPVLSDIYISIDRIKENAQLHGTTQIHELHRVIFHGSLHLCGYRDKKKSDILEIRKKEDHYLLQYFVPRETKKSNVSRGTPK